MAFPFDGFSTFPFNIIFGALGIVFYILIIVFWIWMIIDCAQRNFKNDTEKIVWILVIVLASYIGAIIYFFVIKNAKQKGISKKK